MTPAITLRFHPLAMRRDGTGWVIGRIETGEFIQVPDVAHRAIELLGSGLSVGEATTALSAETGVTLAVDRFADELDELGFVSHVNGERRPDTGARRPSLPWVRPRHVRWLLSRAAACGAVAVAVAVAVLLIEHPALLPRQSYLAWSRHAGLALLVDAAIAWALVGAHELAHLATARAAGAPSRITVSTRLQFLAAQTDVSGVWAAPRRVRMTVYLAGMAMDLCWALIAALLLVSAAPGEVLLRVVCAEALLMQPTQFMVFMRTDLYFVLQDIIGCANLYADGSGYLRHLLRRGAPDPTVGYQPSRRRAVRGYSVLLVAGTAACLAVEFAVSLPALVTLMYRAFGELLGGAGGWVDGLDGASALILLVSWQVLWAWRWWARHRYQVRRLLACGREVKPSWKDAAPNHPRQS
jgi:putative peptide zinc metalloprotease protein